MKYEVKPAYVPFTQHRWCCVPTVLQMIFYRRGIPLRSQEDIGYELGLQVPEKDKTFFNRVRVALKKPAAGYGTQAHTKGFSINDFFRKYKLNLTETLYGIEDIEDIKKFIIQNIKKGNDLILGFNDRKINPKGWDGGHVCLLSSFDDKKEIVIFINPSTRVSNYQEIKLSKLLSAMKYHGKSKGGGFWVISEK